MLWLRSFAALTRDSGWQPRRREPPRLCRENTYKTQKIHRSEDRPLQLQNCPPQKAAATKTKSRRRRRDRLAYDYESGTAACQQVALRVVDFANAETVAAFFVFLPTGNRNLRFNRNRLAVFNIQLGGDGALFGKLGELTHHLVQQNGDDAAVGESCSTRIARAENKSSAGAARLLVQLERQLHAGVIGAATTKTVVGGIRFENEFICHIVVIPGVARSRSSIAQASSSPRVRRQ